jgi:hypothetical protein
VLEIYLQNTLIYALALLRAHRTRSGLLEFWTFSSVLNTALRKLDLFPSSGEGSETPTLLGPLERASLNHRCNWSSLTPFSLVTSYEPLGRAYHLKGGGGAGCSRMKACTCKTNGVTNQKTASSSYVVSCKFTFIC